MVKKSEPKLAITSLKPKILEKDRFGLPKADKVLYLEEHATFWMYYI